MSNPSSDQLIEKSLLVTDASNNPVDLLAEASEISKSKVKRAMTAGAVWLSRGKKTRRYRRAKGRLRVGDKIAIYYDDKILNLEPTAPTLISDAAIYSVWYKPSGLLSSGSKFGDHCAINRWIELNTKPQKPVFIVHRLDRFATGLMVLAHTKQAAAELSRQFRERLVSKHYQVIVTGILDTPQTITQALDDKEAISIVKGLKINTELNRSLLEVEIKTGRKHQIRRHLAHIGHPVIGDRQYGPSSNEELQLTACQLSFDHPQTGVRQKYVLDKALRPPF